MPCAALCVPEQLRTRALEKKKKQRTHSKTFYIVVVQYTNVDNGLDWFNLYLIVDFGLLVESLVIT